MSTEASGASKLRNKPRVLPFRKRSFLADKLRMSEQKPVVMDVFLVLP
jgi:hypothetical protein